MCVQAKKARGAELLTRASTWGVRLPAHRFRQSPGCFILSLGTDSILKPMLIGCTGCLATRRPIVFGFKMPTSVGHSKYNCFYIFFFSKSLGIGYFVYFFPPTRNQTHAPALKVQTLNHWTTKKVPQIQFLIRYLCLETGKKVYLKKK